MAAVHRALHRGRAAVPGGFVCFVFVYVCMCACYKGSSVECVLRGGPLLCRQISFEPACATCGPAAALLVLFQLPGLDRRSKQLSKHFTALFRRWA